MSVRFVFALMQVDADGSGTLDIMEFYKLISGVPSCLATRESKISPQRPERVSTQPREEGVFLTARLAACLLERNESSSILPKRCRTRVLQ